MANKRDAGKERRWRDLLRRQVAGGLSVRAFCEREGLAESAFYFWRRTLAERNGGAKPVFVRAVVTSARVDTRDDGHAGTSVSAGITIELAGGCRARLAGETAIEQLAELAMALQARAAR